MRTLFVGDISLDLSLETPHVPAPDEKVHCTACHEGLGGVVTNTAVAFARAGGAAVLAVQTGSDMASAEAKTRVLAENISLQSSTRAGALCRVVTMLEPHGEKRLMLYPGVSLFPDANTIDALDWSDCSHLHTACFGPGWADLITHARARNVSWSLDLEPASFRDGIATLSDALMGARWVFCNDRAADALGVAAVEVLFDRGVKAVIRTHGPGGATYHAPGIDPIAVPAPSGLRIVDTTGAGDCFAGWFLAGRAAGLSIEATLARAVRAASLSCGKLGTQAGYPMARDLTSDIKAEEVR